MQRKRYLTPLTWPAISFAAMILLGTLALCLPVCHGEGASLSVVDAAFLSTSAVCVTGLSPVDISQVLSPVGQGVMLVLIQVGGLGVMTYTSLIFLLWRKQVPFTSREAVSQALLGGDFNMGQFLLQVVCIVLGVELLAALVLFLHDPVFFSPFSALFHAVSAFCNAGFALAPDNMVAFREDGLVCTVICICIVLGGIGFGVLRECLGILSRGRLAPVTRLSRLSRLVINTSLFLIVAGALLIFVVEWRRAGNEDLVGDGLHLFLISLFHSISARTAGFNMVDMANWSHASLMVLMVLMFIGGGPGSCAGGIKIVTFRLLVGYVVLLVINPAGAGEAIVTIVKNFMTYSKPSAQLKYLGSTLVKTAPLLMCSLSVLFAYKVGLFNIGAAGQYVVGAGASLYCALAWGMPWYVCLLAAIVAGAALGAISGLLKAYCNVNEVISCIMLNWISLYLVNMLLSLVKESASPYTMTLSSTNPGAILPSMGLEKLFNDNKYVTVAIPLAILVAILIWVLLEKTKLGYELKATGCNKFAAKYCGMKEKKNLILTMAIAGGLAGMGAAMLFLTGFEQWQCTQSSVPAMGFNGIAAAFLGGLSPIGTILSSYFIQHITNGGAYVDKTMYSAQISDFISALIIYLCSFVLFFKQFMSSRVARKEERERERLAAQEAAAAQTDAANGEGGGK